MAYEVVTGGKYRAEQADPRVDVLLIGSGIISATLGVYLTELEPDLTFDILELLDEVAEENSNGWNNTGTGHSALCELNYTPLDKNGDVLIARAIAINEPFHISPVWSHQLWQAGQRMHIIKNGPGKGGILKLGTEVVMPEDRSIAIHLGASPGGSTSPVIMLSLLEQAFPGRVANPEWQKKLRRIVPNYRHKLNEDPEMLAMVWQDIETALQRAIPSPSLDGVNAGSTQNDNPADVKQVRDRPL